MMFKMINEEKNNLDELAYGTRVNYSVFECQLNKTKLKKVKTKIRRTCK
ncbi:CRISPR-associated endonuclease Cas2 [Aliarcobacter butzleri]